MYSLMVWPAWVSAGADLVVGLGLALGILLMNFPQHYQCWKHRSAEGLSLAYILICTISNVTLWLATLLGDYNVILTAAMGTSNTTVIDFNGTAGLPVDLTVNSTWSTSYRSLIEHPPSDRLEEQHFFAILLRIFDALNACMPTFQNFLSVLVGVPSLILYYFLWSTPLPPSAVLLEEPPARPASQEPLLRRNPIEEEEERNTPIHAARLYYSDGSERGWARTFSILTWTICLLCTLISAVVLMHNSRQWEMALLEGFGTTAAVTNLILYIPQIVTTHRNQHEGVLSLSSLFISVVGDAVTAVFWTFGAGESIWVMASLAADAGMQLILIAMIINFRKKRFRQQQQPGIYEYVNDNADIDDAQCDMGKGEIEVVLGDLFEICSDTATVVGRLLDSPSRESHSSTSPESLASSTSDPLICPSVASV